MVVLDFHRVNKCKCVLKVTAEESDSEKAAFVWKLKIYVGFLSHSYESLLNMSSFQGNF